MLSLQCAKATAAFVRSKDGDIVAQVSKCGSSGLDLIFPVLYSSNNFIAVRVGTSTSRVRIVCFFVSFFGFMQKDTSILAPYDM